MICESKDSQSYQSFLKKCKDGVAISKSENGKKQACVRIVKFAFMFAFY